VTSGQNFENKKYHEMSQGTVKMWNTCTWLRGELVTAEKSGRSWKRKPSRSKKQQSFQTEENLK